MLTDEQLAACAGHTAGPWRADWHGHRNGITIRNREAVAIAGVMRGQGPDGDESAPNANLIALAPELLAEVLRLRAFERTWKDAEIAKVVQWSGQADRLQWIKDNNADLCCADAGTWYVVTSAGVTGDFATPEQAIDAARAGRYMKEDS